MLEKIRNKYNNLKLSYKNFVKIGIILCVFVMIIIVCNYNTLYHVYIHKEKTSLKSISASVDEIDLYSKDRNKTKQKFNELFDDTSYFFRIYDSYGIIISSEEPAITDYKGTYKKGANPFTRHPKYKEGFEITEYNDAFTALKYTCKISGGEVLEIWTPIMLLKRSAQTATQFIYFTAIFGLIICLIWTIYISINITKPIIDISRTTKKMANLDFSEKLTPMANDEIGALSESINIMSDNLYKALIDLEEKNKRLTKEVEFERNLDATRKAFIANVSHELKTPIAIILGYAEGLNLMLKDDNKEAKEYNQIIIDESERMNFLVLSIMELSKLESGQSTLDDDNYNISEQIAVYLRRLNVKLNEKNITVENHIQSDLFVHADENKILQVIANYLNNAISHSPNNGTIKVYSKEKDDNIRIYIYNKGDTIPREDMKNIWNSFWRGDKSHKREKERFGLGLSIVRAIMTLHNEPFGVYNERDGVVFWFQVPKYKS